jgi:hypothetical protein
MKSLAMMLLMTMCGAVFAASHKDDGGGAAIDYAKDLVSETLKDPDSVQYKNLRYVAAKDAVCGQYNAKNAMGGYVGFHYFAVDADGVHVLRFPSELPRVQTTTERLAQLDAGQVEARLVGDLCLDSEPK